MKVWYYGAAALTLLLMNNPSYGDNPSSNSNSNYEATKNGGYVSTEKKESTDAAGNTTTSEMKKSVDVDSNGNTTTKADVKDTTDPKGLLNKKQTTEVKTTATEKDGKTEYSHKKIVNGTEVDSVKEEKQSNP